MLPEDIGITQDLGWPLEIRLLLSVLLIGVVLGLRWLIVRQIRSRSDILTDDQRWWLTTVRNVASVVLVFGLVAIWAGEIKDFALSITAFVLALVIATKELLLCVSGATLRGFSAPFQVGDWIEIGDHSGEVIDETLLVTVLQEVNPHDFRFTGRTISVPNSQLLTANVVNHNFRKRFLLHEFTLTAPPGIDAIPVRDATLERLREAASDFVETGRRYAHVIEKGAGIKLPEIEPSCCLGTNDYANATFRFCLFCPRERAAELEQAATAAFARALAEGSRREHA